MDKFEVGGEGGPDVMLRNMEELPWYRELGPFLYNPKCYNLPWLAGEGAVLLGEGWPSQHGEEEEGVVIGMLCSHECYDHVVISQHHPLQLFQP